MYIDYYKIKDLWFEIRATDKAVVSIATVSNPKDNHSNLLTKECYQQLKAYFDGKIHKFNIPIEAYGTSFQQKVWKELQNIPYGKTLTYKQLAEKVGGSNYARAVGGACHNNPILILIPCHRVLGSNQQLTGFAAGVDMKQHLLELEQQ